MKTRGIFHPWSWWFEWLSSPFVGDHYRAAVIVAGDPDGWYSCGMHQFGLPDATVPGDGQEVRETLEAFNKYLLIEKTELGSGHTFSKDADSPRRRLKLTADDRFEPAHLFHNPHGLWQMEEI